jgi:DNA replication protein DnaC
MALGGGSHGSILNGNYAATRVTSGWKSTRGSIIITSNLPFDEWTEVFGSERLTGAILDRLTHHVHILEMNGESFRLRQSRTTKT